MRSNILRNLARLGAVLLLFALFLPFASGSNGPLYSEDYLIVYIIYGSLAVKFSALLLYGGTFLLLFTDRFQTLVLIGGVSFVLIASEQVAFDIGMIVLVAGIALTSVGLWWKAIAEAFEEGDGSEQTEPLDHR